MCHKLGSERMGLVHSNIGVSGDRNIVIEATQRITNPRRRRTVELVRRYEHQVLFGLVGLCLVGTAVSAALIPDYLFPLGF